MRAVISVLSVLVPFASLSAQVQPNVEAGARVRVMQECHQTYTGATMRPRTVCPRLVATFESVLADSVVLTLDDDVTSLAVPLDSVTRFDVHGGRRSRLWLGALIGLAVGAPIGAVVGAADAAKEPESVICYDSTVSCAFQGAAGLGLVGALFGLGIGALIKSDRWEEVPLDQLRVQPVATPDGQFGLAASLGF